MRHAFGVGDPGGAFGAGGGGGLDEGDAAGVVAVVWLVAAAAVAVPWLEVAVRPDVALACELLVLVFVECEAAFAGGDVRVEVVAGVVGAGGVVAVLLAPA